MLVKRLSLVAVLALGACAVSPTSVAGPVSLKATCHLPTGTTLDAAEFQSATIFTSLRADSAITAIQTVSRPAECEIYIRIKSDHAVEEFRAMLQRLGLRQRKSRLSPRQFR
jgi:hypothetical protein